MSGPDAVLLDVGGVIFLPAHDRMLGAMGRSGFDPPEEVSDRWHYVGAARLDTPVDSVWPEYWNDYLDAFLTACDVPDDLRADALDHLASEHAVSGLWTRLAPGAVEGLAAL